MSADNVPGLRVLVVEDNTDGADTLAMVLRLDGYDVEIARDGPSALVKGQEYKPDVVLLDLGLPGMTGYEVAKAIVGRRPARTPLIVAVTGYGEEEARRKSAEAGIDLHLLKPVDPGELHGVLERFRRVVGE
jgi:CheY-like chemotaxis protein